MRVNNKQNIIKFYDEMASEWGFESSSGIIVTLGNFNEHVGKYVEGFEAVHGGMALGKKCRRKKQVKETEKIGLKKEDALNRDKYRDGSASTCKRNGVNLAISAKGTTPDKTE